MIWGVGTVQSIEKSSKLVELEKEIALRKNQRFKNKFVYSAIFLLWKKFSRLQIFKPNCEGEVPSSWCKSMLHLLVKWHQLLWGDLSWQVVDLLAEVSSIHILLSLSQFLLDVSRDSCGMKKGMVGSFFSNSCSSLLEPQKRPWKTKQSEAQTPIRANTAVGHLQMYPILPRDLRRLNWVFFLDSTRSHVCWIRGFRSGIWHGISSW